MQFQFLASISVLSLDNIASRVRFWNEWGFSSVPIWDLAGLG